MWHHLLWQQYWTFYSEVPTFSLIYTIFFSVPHYFISAPFSSIFLPSPLFWFCSLTFKLCSYLCASLSVFKSLSKFVQCCLQHFSPSISLSQNMMASCTVNMRKRKRERDLNFALSAQYRSVCVFGQMQASLRDSQDVNLVKCKCTAW